MTNYTIYFYLPHSFAPERSLTIIADWRRHLEEWIQVEGDSLNHFDIGHHIVSVDDESSRIKISATPKPRFERIEAFL